jgi:ArsR family transcriptional regulator, arsenate/arsenite/antimonite-responsive transcriptional repressor
MEMTTALDRLGALAHETRLALFRRLVQQGPDGLAAGALAAGLGIPAPTLSFHVAQLERAGLVEGRRSGRSIVYAASYPAMQELLAYLYENCCQGAGCAPVTKLAKATSAGKGKRR